MKKKKKNGGDSITKTIPYTKHLPKAFAMATASTMATIGTMMMEIPSLPTMAGKETGSPLEVRLPASEKGGDWKIGRPDWMLPRRRN